MVRITDPEKSRAFYEALGFRFERDMDIVRDGEKEATNYFFSVGGHDSVLELTYNHDGRTYDLGTGYGHIALAVDDLGATLTRWAGQSPPAWSARGAPRPWWGGGGGGRGGEPYRVREGGSLICFVRDPDGYR